MSFLSPISLVIFVISDPPLLHHGNVEIQQTKNFCRGHEELGGQRVSFVSPISPVVFVTSDSLHQGNFSKQQTKSFGRGHQELETMPQASHSSISLSSL